MVCESTNSLAAVGERGDATGEGRGESGDLGVVASGDLGAGNIGEGGPPPPPLIPHDGDLLLEWNHKK